MKMTERDCFPTSHSNSHIFAIGDIHGCLDHIKRLMERLPYVKGRDILVFLGDYIDRGHDSRGVLDFLCGLQDTGHETVMLMGNHEYYLLEAARRGDENFMATLRLIGAEATLQSYGLQDLSQITNLAFMPERHRRFMQELKPLWEIEDFIFVHAGLEPFKTLNEQRPPVIYEIRDAFFSSDFDFGKTVVFGHTPFETPFLAPGRIGIDTGAVYGNLLTAVELPDVRFYFA